MTDGIVPARISQNTLKRFAQLNAGIALIGFSIALLLQCKIGLDPWTVFHQGLALQLGISIGRAIILTGAFVAAAGYFLLGQRIGIGSLLNALVVGPWVDLFSQLNLCVSDHAFIRILEFMLGVALLGLGTAVYIAANFGAGPRDMLILGIAKRYNKKINLVRTCIELTILLLGFEMGGRVGVGTALFAVSIGWFMHFFLRVLKRTA